MTMSADSTTLEVHPLFPVEGGGANPTSALQLTLRKISLTRAQILNAMWHSRLPDTDYSNIKRAARKIFYGAEYQGRWYGAAIWTDPIARHLNGKDWLELRRLAIAPDAPANTASRLLGVMRLLIRREFPAVVKLVSYQDTEVHAGTIYKAAGWWEDFDSKGSEWDRPSRSRRRTQTAADKVRWATATYPFCPFPLKRSHESRTPAK